MFVLPDYENSIVNLMSSIAKSYGVRLKYKPLEILDLRKLKGAKNVVLLVIDGLGVEFVKKNSGKGSVFVRNRIGEITSVFPSTTMSAITTFLTGSAPQEHGLAGWFMNLKELGGVGVVLKWEMRNKSKIKIEVNKFFKQKPFLEKIRVNSYCVAPKEIIRGEFNKRFTKRAKKLGYNSLKGMFYQLGKVIRKRGRKFVYAYWPGLDGLGHEHGMESRKVKKHFKEIERELEKFVRRMKGRNMVLLVTGDHGLIDVGKEKRINLNKHKEFMDCLSCAVCGEARVGFCYVRPGKVKEFESYVKRKLGKYCEMFKSEELVRKGYFGKVPGKEHEKLKERIGDYTLIAKENYALKDFLLGEKVKFNKASHGGVSKEEMGVPLVVVEG